MIAGQIHALKLPRISKEVLRTFFKKTGSQDKKVSGYQNIPAYNKNVSTVSAEHEIDFFKSPYEQTLSSLIEKDQIQLKTLKEEIDDCTKNIKTNKRGLVRAAIRDLGYIPIGALGIAYGLACGWKFVPLLAYLSAGYAHPILRELKYYKWGGRSPASWWRDLDKWKTEREKLLAMVPVVKKRIDLFEEQHNALRSLQGINKV
jgi:hypothetical protein